MSALPLFVQTDALSCEVKRQLRQWQELCNGNFMQLNKLPAQNSEDTELLISFVKPQKRIRRDTLSTCRWVKILLHSAGTDTMQFNPHRTREASTTAARRNSISLQGKEKGKELYLRV